METFRVKQFDFLDEKGNEISVETEDISIRHPPSDIEEYLPSDSDSDISDGSEPNRFPDHASLLDMTDLAQNLKINNQKMKNYAWICSIGVLISIVAILIRFFETLDVEIILFKKR